MLNPLYEKFPDFVRINGRKYRIITDFREWIRFADMFCDRQLAPEEKLTLLAAWFIEKPEILTDETIEKLVDFYKAGLLEPDTPEDDDSGETPEANSPPVFDWKIDARFIIGDFLHYYGIDLLNAKMHWWHFRSLLTALPEDSQCKKRMAYRSVNLGEIKDSKERARILRIQRSIAIPFELDDEDIGAVFGNFK